MGLPNINELTRDICKEYREYAQQTIKRVENGFLMVQLLASEGLFLDVSTYNLRWGHTFTVTPQQLGIVRRVLGHLAKCRLDPVEKTRNKVWDVRCPVDERFADFKFQFKTTLPADAKCKIVKTRRSETLRFVVCGV